MEELRNQLINSAMEEIDDVRKYMDLSKMASGATMGILKDIAHDEYTHAMHLKQILESNGGAPEELAAKWKDCEEAYKGA